MKFVQRGLKFVHGEWNLFKVVKFFQRGLKSVQRGLTFVNRDVKFVIDYNHDDLLNVFWNTQRLTRLTNKLNWCHPYHENFPWTINHLGFVCDFLWWSKNVNCTNTLQTRCDDLCMTTSSHTTHAPSFMLLLFFWMNIIICVICNVMFGNKHKKLSASRKFV